MTARLDSLFGGRAGDPIQSSDHASLLAGHHNHPTGAVLGPTMRYRPSSGVSRKVSEDTPNALDSLSICVGLSRNRPDSAKLMVLGCMPARRANSA